MTMLKRWLQKAQEAADRHLPAEVVEGGRRLAERVLERAPEAVRATVQPWLDGAVEADVEAAPAPQEVRREFEEESRAPKVIVFGYPEEAATQRVWALFAAEGIEIRRMNLHQQPEAARQIAGLTGVMVPPYVYIHGRFWGGEGEVLSLKEMGDLGAVIENRMEDVSAEGRRIGKVRDEFDEAMTPANIAARLRQGHIIAMEDLDCWCEAEPGGGLRIFYEGHVHPLSELEAIAAQIAGRVERGEVEARWLFEPAVSTH
jgi:glutaredoxin-related protein